MDMQNVAKLDIPEGEVRTIHDKDGNLIWGKVSYDVKYRGDTAQAGTPTPSAPVPVKTVTGENVVKITDGQGAEQSYEVNLGKNLADIDFTSGTGNGVTKTLNADESITLNGHTTSGHNFVVSKDMTFEPGQTYTLSVEILSGSFVPYNSTQDWAVQVNLADPNASPSTISSNTLTTSGITIQYTSQIRRTVRVVLWFGYNSGTTSEMAIFNNFTFRVQVEKGSTATSYAPYFTPIELCKIGDYQDYIYKSDGKWYIRKEVEKIPSYAGETISTDYISTTGSLTAGATIYYALVTPTDTEITNQALVAQLEAVEQWLTRYGYNATVTGDLPIIIDRTAL